MLGGDGAHPDTGVVDEHVETPVALTVAPDDLTDRLLIPQVRSDVLDLEPLVGELARGPLERLGVARCDRQGEPLLAERLRESPPDPAGGSGHDRGALRHRRNPSGWKVWSSPGVICR